MGVQGTGRLISVPGEPKGKKCKENETKIPRQIMITGTIEVGADGGTQLDYGQNSLEGSAAYHWSVTPLGFKKRLIVAP